MAKLPISTGSKPAPTPAPKPAPKPAAKPVAKPAMTDTQIERKLAQDAASGASSVNIPIDVFDEPAFNQGVITTDTLEQQGDLAVVAAKGDPTLGGTVGAFTAPNVYTSSTVTNINNTTNLDPLMELQKQQAAAARVDAFKLLEDVFTSYGLAELVPSIKELMQGVTDPVTGKIVQVGPSEAALLLKTDKRYNAPYLARFAGNTARVAAGLNALPESTYLEMEKNYGEILNQYGQKGLATKAEFANLIGGDVSTTELNSRLDLAVLQVQNADPQIKKTLQDFYPGISDSDLVTYFLKPDETLPKLQQKVTAAQIGTAATEQGLKTSVATAEDLAKYGVKQQQAQTGYAKIGEIMPAATKLSNIYGEAQVGYDQATAESEVFKGLASAQRKREQLQQLEQAAFSGRSGINQQVNPLGKGLQGSF
jgi:hypothetical protein